MWWMTTVATSAELDTLPCDHAICAIAADPDGAGFEEEPTRRRDEPTGPIAISLGADPTAVSWQVVANPDVRLIVESRVRIGQVGHPDGPHATTPWAGATHTVDGWWLARPTPAELDGLVIDGLEIRVRAVSSENLVVDEWRIGAEIPSGC